MIERCRVVTAELTFIRGMRRSSKIRKERVYLLLGLLVLRSRDMIKLLAVRTIWLEPFFSYA